MSLFKGAGVALITPFNKDKSVNYDELGRIIDRQIEGKTDALIVCGTTGEPATMTEEERLSVIEFAEGSSFISLSSTPRNWVRGAFPNI